MEKHEQYQGKINRLTHSIQYELREEKPVLSPIHPKEIIITGDVDDEVNFVKLARSGKTTPVFSGMGLVTSETARQNKRIEVIDRVIKDSSSIRSVFTSTKPNIPYKKDQPARERFSRNSFLLFDVLRTKFNQSEF